MFLYHDYMNMLGGGGGVVVAQGEMNGLAEEIIDDDLTLLLVKGDGVPRLGIYNTNTNKKKYVHLSWVEGAGRSLKIKVGRSGTKEYSVDTMRSAIQCLVEKADGAMLLKSLVWRVLQVLGDLLHMPKTARSEADVNLIAENKRDTLWFAYTPRDGAWRVRPSFIMDESERGVMDAYVVDGKPWPGIPIEMGKLPMTMRNLAVTKELFLANPARWNQLLLPISKGLLLGYSDWSAGGEHLFGDALWTHLLDRNYRSEDSLLALAAVGRQFLVHMTSYLRLWPVMEKLEAEECLDSTKTAEERGLRKRDRFEMTSQHLDDRRFKVTKYVDENTTAFGLIPETRLPGEMDRFVTLGHDDWEASHDACSLGGEKDPQYTCCSVIWGLETKAWLNEIHKCVGV